MHRLCILLGAVGAFAAGLATTPAPTAWAKPMLTIRGAGFGHGVGMSQFGARGFALRGAGYRAILRQYYSGTRLGSAGSGRRVRVLLAGGLPVASFTGASKAGGRKTDPAVGYQLVMRGARMELRNAGGRKLDTLAAPVRVSGPGFVNLRGSGNYRGVLDFTPAEGRVDVVNELSLDDYTAGVIGSEVSASWPTEALKAQAVAARTYAITTDPGGALFDQWPDTRSQVYGGVRSEHPRTLAAVRATAGQVVTYGGRPVVTYYFSTSGGMTEDGELVFGGAGPRPWLRAVLDPYDRASPRHRWRVNMTPAAAGRRLRGLVKGDFRGIRVLERGRSPRVRGAEIVGTRGLTVVTGATLRSRLGLPDTWAYFAVVG